MPEIWQAVDAIEPIADSTIESIANIANYNVISGCGATYSASDMVKTIAAGSVTHNGSTVTVAGNTVTLVSDPSNPRWTWTGINSSGTAVIVSGDPAAVPTVPERGDIVSVSLDLVQAGQTIANNVVTQLDKRVMGIVPVVALAGSSTASTSTTSTSAVDLVMISGLSIAASAIIETMWQARKVANTANYVAFGLKLNSTVVLEAGAAWGRSSATQQAEDGLLTLTLGPRSANYPAGIHGNYGWRISATGATAVNPVNLIAADNLTTLPPQVAITSMAIRAINATASNAAEIAVWKIWTK